jgi:acetolactate synthase-1/2/3 large subunit
MKKRSGGNILIEALRAHGVKKIFCVPGESYLDALDALVDAGDMRVITCRQEGGAAFMAEAYAKLTGHPGVCFVTRGPGACNASIGLHTAMQDSTPMIVLIGQVARDQRGREAFQEIDYRKFFQPPISKWAVEIDNAADIPKVIEQAFKAALSGRPGPVAIALPEDMLCDESDVAVNAPAPLPHFGPTPAEMAAIKSLLSGAQRPLAIVGGGGWTDKSIQVFQQAAEKLCLPVVTGFRRQDAFDNAHPNYAGVLGTTVDQQLLKTVEDSDVILAVGTRLGEILTQGYTIIQPGQPKQKLIHVYPDASELNRVYKSEIAVVSDMLSFAEALSAVTIDKPVWEQRTKDLNARFKAWSGIASRDKFALDLDGVLQDLISVLPEDAIIITDAGNFSGWAQRFIRYRRPMRLLAPTSGAMGYGVPAAVAASLTHPGRVVVGFMGDGGFMMSGQELATAMHEGAHPIFLVFDNGMYGTIRMHQEKHYPGRVSATDLTNPDFAALAASYGMQSATVARTADFLPAFKAMAASKKPGLICLKMDPQQITTAKTLTQISTKT